MRDGDSLGGFGQDEEVIGHWGSTTPVRSLLTSRRSVVPYPCGDTVRPESPIVRAWKAFNFPSKKNTHIYHSQIYTLWYFTYTHSTHKHTHTEKEILYTQTPILHTPVNHEHMQTLHTPTYIDTHRIVESLHLSFISWRLNALCKAQEQHGNSMDLRR